MADPAMKIAKMEVSQARSTKEKTMKLKNEKKDISVVVVKKR